MLCYVMLCYEHMLSSKTKIKFILDFPDCIECKVCFPIELSANQ